MKLHKLIISLILIGLLWGCTTKSDTYYNRQFRMIPTMYNVLYNGNLALEKGKKELAEKHTENYFGDLRSGARGAPPKYIISREKES